VNANLMGSQLTDEEVRDFMQRVDLICNSEKIERCYWYAWGQNDPGVLGIPFNEWSEGTQELSRLRIAD